MQAVILAAGRGERLRPLTDTVPKPLIQIARRAMVEYVLDVLPDAITEIIFIVGYRGEQIKKHFGFSWRGKPIYYLYQKGGRTGTFGALAAAREKLHHRFLVLASDVFYKKEDLNELLKYPLSLLVRKEVGDGSRRIAQCAVDNGLLRRINEVVVPKGEVFANSSAYVLDERIFNESIVRGKNGEEWLSVMTGNLATRVPVRAVLTNFHATVTTPNDIPRVEEKVKRLTL